jgi:sulfite reductase alpha subunit-like flavoprotein
MAKKVHRRLSDLGGTCIGALGLGNEQAPLGHYSSLTPWMLSVFSLLKCAEPSGTVYLTKFKCIWMPQSSLEDHQACTNIRDDIQKISIKDISRLTAPDHFQTVLKIDFDIPFAMKYRSGDIVEIFSSNEASDVDDVMDLFGWTPYADKLFQLVPNRSDAYFPAWIIGSPFVLTFRQLLMDYFLISHTTPNQRFFSFLATILQPHLPDLYSEKLSELGNLLDPEGTTAYQDYCWRPKRRILEILRDFILLPIGRVYLSLSPEFCFDLFQWIKPRSFSISSAPSQNKLSITMALVEYPSALLKTPRIGFLSSTIKEQFVLRFTKVLLLCLLFWKAL